MCCRCQGALVRLSESRLKLPEEGPGLHCSHWHWDALLNSQPNEWNCRFPSEAWQQVGEEVVLRLVLVMHPSSCCAWGRCPSCPTLVTVLHTVYILHTLMAVCMHHAMINLNEQQEDLPHFIPCALIFLNFVSSS